MQMHKMLMAMGALLTVPSALAVNVVGDENASIGVNGDKTVLTITQSGTLKVTEAGEIEILVVGGGGGAGGVVSSKYYGGAGGAGGVVHKESFHVEPGSYPVTIGAGGGANFWGAYVDQVVGKSTVVFGLTAHGGGGGANGNRKGGDGYVSGASGGGGAVDQNWAYTYGGSPLLIDDNLGNKGGDPSHYAYGCSGGGGGAGSAAEAWIGGKGYLCSITGVATYYAGGGYAQSPVSTYGGGNTNYGGGGHFGESGGSGVVIISFVAPPPPDSDDFALAGGNRRYFGLDSTALAFTENGTLTVTGEGMLEVLVVGGGGGGGMSYTDTSTWTPYPGGGGGGGGVVYKKMRVTAGTYAVSVGAGGLVNSNGYAFNGGDSKIFDLTAHGGGCGAVYWAKGDGKTGGSGGGGTMATNWYTTKGPYDGNTADGNLANAGAAAGSPTGAGGGGGAGSAASGSNGGDGFACAITGETVYYAGGGSGGGTTGLGGGSSSYGGGGNSGAAGGPGIVIVSYRKAEYASAFDDAKGGNAKIMYREGKRYRVHTFTDDGLFTMAQPGKVELLLVGGGGGGGSVCPSIDYAYGGGGGAGGVVYREAFILDAGEYPIVVGAGGIANDGNVEDVEHRNLMNGGTTTAFGFTALGGGYGAQGGGFTLANEGASGGGGSMFTSDEGVSTIRNGRAGVQGYAGADPTDVYHAGGGGGAGGPGDGVNGGIGVACSITGKEVWYAGGGNAEKGETPPEQGSGEHVYGSGGKFGSNGCQGVVIVAHETKVPGLHLLLR